MDINYKPEMKQDLSSERMFFWDKMVWEAEEITLCKSYTVSPQWLYISLK